MGLKFASADPTWARHQVGLENLHKIPEIWFFSSENLMNAAKLPNWLLCGSSEYLPAFSCG